MSCDPATDPEGPLMKESKAVKFGKLSVRTTCWAELVETVRVKV